MNRFIAAAPESHDYCADWICTISIQSDHNFYLLNAARFILVAVLAAAKPESTGPGKRENEESF